MNEQNPYNQTPLDQGSAESGANSYHAAYGAQPAQPQQAAYTAPHVEPVQIPNAAHVAAGASGAAQQVAANPQHAEKKHGDRPLRPSLSHLQALFWRAFWLLA